MQTSYFLYDGLYELRASIVGMEIEVFVRHTKDCPQKDNRYSKRCRCRKWLFIVGEDRRISAKTRSWEEAERRAKLMIQSGVPQPKGQTIAFAVSAFIADKEQQGVSTIYRTRLKRELTYFSEWCTRHGVVLLSELTLHHLERYRADWPGAPVTRGSRQGRLRTFFEYCLRHRWTEDNPVKRLSSIKIPPTPTLPLSRVEFDRVMEYAARYNPSAPDVIWRQKRAIAMLLLLRWSGLRLGDAVRLERSALRDGNLRLRMAKTGEHVYVPLPPDVTNKLLELENPANRKCFFWSGSGARETTVKTWWRTLKSIFKAAGIPNAHPHMLRDTFAVECLLAGVPLDQVSILLGHTNIRTTERHYAPWVAARQRQLEESVRKSWNN